jgi:hypothetical protein
MKKRVIDSLSEPGTQTMKWQELALKRTLPMLLAQSAASAAGALKSALNPCSERRLTCSNTIDQPLTKFLMKCRKETKELPLASDGAHGF